MREIVQFLFEHSKGGRNFAFPEYNQLQFFFGSDYINLTLDFNGLDHGALPYREEHLNNDESEYLAIIIERFKEISLGSISISFVEYTADRNFEGWNLGYFRSITNTTYYIYQKLSEYKKKLPSDYNFVLNTVSGTEYCNLIYTFTGEISLNIANVDIPALEFLLRCISTSQMIIGSLYNKSLSVNEKIRTSLIPQFLNTNTKVRRLGYIKIFSDLMRQRKKIPETFLSKRYEEYALSHRDELLDLENNKGIINGLNGKSAEPYILLLREFNFITTINRMVVPTKWLQLYNVIKTKSDENEIHSFSLSQIDKLFFLEMILKRDFLYFSVIADLMFLVQETSVKYVIANFQRYLLKRIDNIIKSSRQKDNLTEYKIIERRVLAWKKAIVYLEHIVLPRLNWMADLGLLKLSDDNTVIVTDAGNRLFIELNYWTDLNTGYLGNSDLYLSNFYPAIFSKVLSNTYGETPDKSIVVKDIIHYLGESFSLFSTLAPNRVTSSQAITYVKYMILLYKKYSVSELEIINLLEGELKSEFIYKYQSRYGDGYIQKVMYRK